MCIHCYVYDVNIIKNVCINLSGGQNAASCRSRSRRADTGGGPEAMGQGRGKSLEHEGGRKGCPYDPSGGLPPLSQSGRNPACYGGVVPTGTPPCCLTLSFDAGSGPALLGFRFAPSSRMPAH